MSGCGRDTAQVSGQVRYVDGSQLGQAYSFIQLRPTDDTTAEIRKAASARLKDDGSFELFTRKPGDGVFKGQYKVTFSVTSGPFSQVSLVPEQYTRLDATPFEVDITSDVDDLLFELEKR